MLALPAPATPAPKRQALVATALFCLGGLMLVAGLAAAWFDFRNAAGTTNWTPDGVTIPEVSTNLLWITASLACVMAQWAVWSAKRDDHQHAGIALGVTFMLGLAMVNSQAYVWKKIGLPVSGDTAYNSMFYAFTGTVFALMLIGLIYTVVVGFRYLGGRRDVGAVSAMALYWYFLFAAVTTVWFAVYVTK